MFTGKPAVLKGFDYRGLHRYFLTFCTYERQPLFTCDDHVTLVRMQIQRAAREQGFALIAYCFMPDHLHLLAVGEQDDSDGRCFISLAKQYSGFHFRRRFGGRLWQRYGFERTLREHDQTLSVARYIVENPVRAGLVNAVAAYPYSGSDDYDLQQIVDAIQIGENWKARSG